MRSGLIETGQIVGTHGVNGRLRVQPWADSPELLTGIEYIYIDTEPVRVESAQVHKNIVIMNLEGIDSAEAAMRLKNKVISVKRSEIQLEEGTFFIADLIGLTAIDAGTGNTLGQIADVLSMPANSVYVIKDGNSDCKREILVPAVPEFIIETNIEEGYVRLKLIEGL